VFIAAGSGITPFIPIFNKLANSGSFIKDHTLIYANKGKEDILFKSELKRLLGKNYINILSTTKARNMVSGRIDFPFLKAQIKNPNQFFYICGPKKFEEDIRKYLIQLGAKRKN